LHAVVFDNDDGVREDPSGASSNVPNLTALVAARAVEDVARNNRTTNTLALRMRPPEISGIRLYFSNNIGASGPRI
jgi:hypothetical protein